VHQARVACRRLRSILQVFASLFDPGWAAALHDDLAALATSLGRVRDVEVLLLRLELRAGECGVAHELAGELLESLRREHRNARRALLRRLAAPRSGEVLERLRAAVQRVPVTTERGAEPAAAVLLPYVDTSWRKLRKRVERLPRRPPDADLHRTRIVVKRCRTAVLAVVPLFADRAGRTNSLLGHLQDALGEQHDAVVASAWLAPFAAGELRQAARPILRAERKLVEAGRTAWRQPWRAVDRADVWRWTERPR
jgi:CHAD domain-containing protein